MTAEPQGQVYLVGAGPGHPSLITLRAVECLREADLVLYDGLVNPALLQFTQGVCERTARTRQGNRPVVPQNEINERLIAEARAGRTVVRLKGGDPCIFGRGSEEAEALRRAGIRFELVPGITAATAAAEFSGISLTDRNVSSAVAFVTGHEDPDRSSKRVDYEALAVFPGTLVFYMGLGRLAEICAELIRAGKSADTPAAVICRATLPAQQVVAGTLETLPAVAAAARLQPPSLIVVGDCVSLRQQPSWFEQRPLFGKSIGVTRAREQCTDVASRIVQLGGEPVLMPLIEIQDPDDDQCLRIQQCLDSLQAYDWLILTSANATSSLMTHLFAAGLDSRALAGLRIAAIGSATAECLRSYSLIPDLVPDTFRAESLGEALAEHVRGRRCLWPRASRARDVLPDRLREAGAALDEIVVYQNVDVEQLDDSVVSRIRYGRIDWIGLSSPAIARQLAKCVRAAGILPEQLQVRLATISAVTSEAARQAGLTVDAEASTSTWDGLLEAIIAGESA